MAPGLISPVKLILLILVTVAGFQAFGASDNPNCTINKIFYTPPSAPMSQNVNWLTQLCMSCQIDTLLCTSSARVWCLSKPDKCTDENLGCKELLGASTCPPAAALVATQENLEGTGAVRCPPYMEARGDGKCYCNQHDNDGATLADNNFMSEAACKATYKPPPPVTGRPTPVPPTPVKPGPVTPTPPDPKICGDAKTRAETCCSDPPTCVHMPTPQPQGPSQGESPQIFCKRMQASGFNSGSNNSNASETCQLRINDCNSKCGTSNDACNGLLSQVQGLAQQSLNSFANSDWGRYCAQLTASQPTPQSTNPGGGPPGGGPPGGGGEPPGGGGPSPTEQAMQRQLDAINNAPQGKSEFKDSTPEKGVNGFNVADNQVSPNTQYNSSSKYASAEGGSSIDKIKGGGGGRQGTVANNTGGQIPGGEGGGGGAKLGGGRGPGSPGAPGYSTDVLQGFQGGGGGGGAGGGSTDTNGDAGGGFSGYGGGGHNGQANEGRGLDLRKYLPGGKLDPGSKMGGYKGLSLEINGRGANLWNKISDRFQEKCRLGELIDCK